MTSPIHGIFSKANCESAMGALCTHIKRMKSVQTFFFPGSRVKTTGVLTYLLFQREALPAGFSQYQSQAVPELRPRGGV